MAMTKVVVGTGNKKSIRFWMEGTQNEVFLRIQSRYKVHTDKPKGKGGKASEPAEPAESIPADRALEGQVTEDSGKAEGTHD
jgi:hypothetical protein